MLSIILRVDPIAFYRNYYEYDRIDPSHIAVLAEKAGVDGICCHLREDRLHILDRDVFLLKEIVKTQLILDIAPEADLIDLALEVKPRLVVLMPKCGEKPYIEKGFDFVGSSGKHPEIAARFREQGIPFGFYIDPDDNAVKEAARVRASGVVFNTYNYARAKEIDDIAGEIERLNQAANLAKKRGMKTFASGGLTLENIIPLTDLSVFSGFIISHSIICQSILDGFDKAAEWIRKIKINS